MFGLIVDRNLPITLTAQLTQQLREAILSGKIASGHRMPPTRQLAKELAVSRNSVIQVYEQLIAEGYLTSTIGSGTYVPQIEAVPRYLQKAADTKAVPSHVSTVEDVIVFDPANPDLSAFPRTMWAKMLKEACLNAMPEDFGYGRPGGHPLLIKAIADYLYRAKGIDCEQERIFIVPGTSAGIELISRLLYSEEAAAVTEDPCLHFARHAIEKSGLNIIPVEADASGICVDKLPDFKDVRLIYVASTHHYPLGGILPAKRRIALLDYARRHHAFVIEDDYDSEFRYRGEPIQSLWHLDSESVIHLGSLSNIFAPSLRMAYLVLPQELAAPAKERIDALNIWIGSVEQIALARLMETKRLDRHIFQMKKRYEAKRRFLISCLNDCFGDGIIVSGDNAGLYLTATLPRGLRPDDFTAFAANGVDMDYVEDYALVKGRHKDQLVLGFGNLSNAKIEAGVKRLYKSLIEE